MNTEHPEAIHAKNFTGGTWAAKLDNDREEIAVIVPLMFHVAVQINPHETGGYEERYCMHNQELARKAIEEYERTGEFKYWKKWHTKNISVVGKHAYKAGTLQIPERALYEVDWDITDYERLYPYGGPHATDC